MRVAVCLCALLVLVDCKGCSKPGPSPSPSPWEGDAGPAPASALLLPAAHGKPVEACSNGFWACARLEDGRVACWGDVASDHLPYDRPVLTGIEHATQIDCASRCAVIEGSRLQCWAPLGQATKPPPEQADVLEVRASSSTTTCVRSKDGRVRCGTNEMREPVDGVAGATALSVFRERACAKVADGSVRCWQKSSPAAPVPMGELEPDEAFALGYRGPCRYVSTSPNSGHFECRSPAVRNADAGASSAVLAEIPHAVAVNGRCALDASGEVFCFEANKRLALDLHDAIALATGAASCALRKSGELTCWDASNASVLGRGDTIASSPVAVTGIEDATDLAAGELTTCVVRASGKVACWGGAANGVDLVTIGGLDGAARVTVGRTHACAVTTAGAVACFGRSAAGNELGGRGPGARESSTDASPVPLPRPASRVVVGERFSCALLQDETVMCWGDDSVGQLGDGTTTSREAPAVVPGLSRVKSLAAGSVNACALDADGVARCWGAAHHTTRLPIDEPCSTPQHLALLDGAGSIALGHYGHGAALTPTGEARSFYLDGVPLEGSVWAIAAEAEPPVALRDVVEVALGRDFACGRTKGGVVRCAGANDDGQLGDGTRVGRWDAKDVAGLGTADQIAAGRQHACARLGGKVWCWGDDTAGAVGSHPRTTTPAPVAF